MPTSDAISRVLLVLILALVLSLITASQAYEQEVMQCKMWEYHGMHVELGLC